MQKKEITHLNEHFGNWLTNFHWSHWATLTTRYELTLPSARRIGEGLFKELSKAGDSSIFFAAEPFDCKEGYHLHALINVPPNLSFRNIIQLYQHVSGNKNFRNSRKGSYQCEKIFDSNNREINQFGIVGNNVVSSRGSTWNRIELENYNPKLGATHYIAKYITKDLSDYELLTTTIKPS